MESLEISLATKATAADKRAVIAHWFIFGVAVFVMLLFVYTSVNKLLEYEKFVFQMRLTPLSIMQKAAPLLGWLVPLIELIIVVMLYIECTRIWGLVASFALMMSFEVYIMLMKSTELDLPCTCGGIISKMSWTAHFIFNGMVILLIAAALIIWRKRRGQVLPTNNTIH